jgi:hypothetical protein
MVDLIKYDETIASDSAQTFRSLPTRHLLVGGDQPMDVTSQALTRGPVGVEGKAKTMRGFGPLQFEMAGGRHDHEPARCPIEMSESAGQSECGLTGSGGRNREEIG